MTDTKIPQDVIDEMMGEYGFSIPEAAYKKLKAALRDQHQAVPPSRDDNVDMLLRTVFEVCEATENVEPKNDFERGRVFEAKGIRRGIGNWFQDTFCGRSFMGEPAMLSAAPTPSSSNAEGVEPKTVYVPRREIEIIQSIREAETLDDAMAVMNGVAANGWLNLWDNATHKDGSSWRDNTPPAADAKTEEKQS